MSQVNRADAVRNRELLLAVAREAIVENGTDTSLRDIARRAGVGIGTLYRHFPNREALLEALLESNFATLHARAEHLLASSDPGEAFLTWLQEMAAGAATYQGLPESIRDALADDESRLHASCTRMKTAGGLLLEQAQKGGGVRSDVSLGEVISLALGLAWAAEKASEASDLAARLLSTATYRRAEIDS
ncbi:TetR/AcrR family transcriptional regulator [Actinacidiphila glaucinigra]|uniref:Transcriptional regulator, TetR family n=1 Tax=Actinacidiphila glaucinigra TaxID=235986 RepID=A0A239LVK5_9ACTN|nr:TetR/AcrR family transcriptional regulator [Actinacidiphila glaucinigra]SNT34415.1 transcriptional regulator, TetR family [Actinacidiphila glaucinigra]